ncbi:DUF2793 domain-containing protein [Sphingosinicella soli]|uniref:DUF2793 domain-containing protein n=1 Tax=Sphingosinicella soli TaxID=333708 RepID=A0A7W7B436_9SPHN|nr:DUF2793 domain-containing protein [Sphingosinicella soli]MBB4633656.1 hypothetical protein [Sphingosinicella soli]
MTVTARLGLPLIATGQAQKELTHNAAIHGLDRLVHLCAESRALSAPPELPAADATWIIGDTPTGAWAGHAGGLAHWDGAWTIAPPAEGMLCWIADEAIVAVFGGGAWNADFPVAGLRLSGVSMLGSAPVSIAAAEGGSVIDTEARAVIESLLIYLRTQGLLTS